MIVDQIPSPGYMLDNVESFAAIKSGLTQTKSARQFPRRDQAFGTQNGSIQTHCHCSRSHTSHRCQTAGLLLRKEISPGFVLEAIPVCTCIYIHYIVMSHYINKPKWPF